MCKLDYTEKRILLWEISSKSLKMLMGCVNSVGLRIFARPFLTMAIFGWWCALKILGSARFPAHLTASTLCGVHAVLPNDYVYSSLYI